MNYRAAILELETALDNVTRTKNDPDHDWISDSDYPVIERALAEKIQRLKEEASHV